MHQLMVQQRRPIAEIRRFEMRGAGCGALHQVSESDAMAAKQDVHSGFAWNQFLIHQIRTVERLPEAVLRPGKIKSRSHRVQGWIKSNRNNVEITAQIVVQRLHRIKLVLLLPRNNRTILNNGRMRRIFEPIDTLLRAFSIPKKNVTATD